MFERFTDRSRRVIVLAQEQARQMNHNHLGTEHLLMGMLAEGEGIAAQALLANRIQLKLIRDKVREIVGVGLVPALGHIPFTPRGRNALEQSLRESLRLGHNFIGTEHLLLAVLFSEGTAVQIITDLGLTPAVIRQSVFALIGANREPEGAGDDRVFRSLTADLSRLSRSGLAHEDWARDLLLSYNITPKA
ncbi:Clp protease N-terminal domain-containing protein [Mycolicibacterium canariasense]|nr:Clp protease N-terminal domain-containing protein [Mycolicibacterium canariasense]MCV7208368.1 hypothetical protein [Mycolicibacterium canariasense]